MSWLYSLVFAGLVFASSDQPPATPLIPAAPAAVPVAAVSACSGVSELPVPGEIFGYPEATTRFTGSSKRDGVP